ncbi:MAG: hypothetical protein A2X36_14505 [Elusimicrobia bacterium GWA2_69_24]|nr:MAG: hypothetical protein A2X36_14505 [Elusimicrobia bacterium GWA2_69_24]HBL18395.1 response regulator [Elusimicrobiota bacterium]
MEGAPQERADPKTKFILVADDDEGIRELMKVILGKEGFEVGVAEDGREALSAVQARRPDLIMLDLMMPGMGGYEVLRALQDGPTSGIPVILMTGRTTDLSMVDMIRQEPNVVEYYDKPIRAAVLAMTVHRILNTRKPA